MTAKDYKGSDIVERGGATHVFPRNQVYPSAMALAEKMAKLPRNTLIALKHQFTQNLCDQLEETYQLELAMHAKTFVNNSKALSQIQEKFTQI